MMQYMMLMTMGMQMMTTMDAAPAVWTMVVLMSMHC